MQKSFTSSSVPAKMSAPKFPYQKKSKIFDKFWESNCWQSQENFSASCVLVTPAKRHYVQNSIKQNSRTFFLNKKRVCKMVFLRTLGITNGRMSYCITKKTQHNICSPDKRGSAMPNRTSDVKIK